MNQEMNSIVQWALIIGCPVLIVTFLTLYANRFRADLLVEVEETETKISKFNGPELLRLSNQLYTIGTGSNESIIAVGKPGEYGHSSAESLPLDARINCLLEETLKDNKRGAKLWNQFLRYCGAIGIKEARVNGRPFNMAFIASRVYVYSKIHDERIQRVVTKSIGSWLSCSAPQLVKFKPIEKYASTSRFDAERG